MLTRSTALPGEALQQKELEELVHFLFRAADLLRGRMDPSDCKYHLCSLLVYKRLCDIWEEEEYAQIVFGFAREATTSGSAHHRFHIPKGCFWADVRRLPAGYGRALDANLRTIEKHNLSLDGVFQKTGFAVAEHFPESLLRQLLLHLDCRRLGRADVDSRMLGTGCELLLERLAESGGLKYGERDSPRGIARLLVALVQPDAGQSLYDPVCGTAGLLAESVRYLEHAGKDPQSLSLFGQEKNYINWALCNMVLALHEISDASIRLGDTLENPQFVDGDCRLRRFDLVIANPPFSLSRWSEDGWHRGDRFGRTQYGVPPASCGDYAFVLHMLASLKEGGHMAVVLPHGVLSRGRAEAQIRAALLREDLVEAEEARLWFLFGGTRSA